MHYRSEAWNGDHHVYEARNGDVAAGNSTPVHGALARSSVYYEFIQSAEAEQLLEWRVALPRSWDEAATLAGPLNGAQAET